MDLKHGSIPPGQGGNTSGNIERPAARRARRISSRFAEKRNPGNLEFERQVAALEAKQQEQERRRQISRFPLEILVPWTTLSHEHGEDDFDFSHLSSFIAQLRTLDTRSQPDSAMASSSQVKSAEPNKAPDLDFLDGIYINVSSDKKQGTKSKNKNKKKKKKKGKCKKDCHASEIQFEQPTDSFGLSHDSASGETLPLPSNSVTVLEFSLRSKEFSSSDSTANSSVAGSSENEYYTGCNTWNSQGSNTKSNNDFKSLDSTTDSSVVGSSESACYTDYALKTMHDDTGGTNDTKNFGATPNSNVAGSLESGCYIINAMNNMAGDTVNFSWSASELRDSSGFNEWGGGGNKPNHCQSFSCTINSVTCGNGQDDSLNNEASRDDDFQQVVSRRRAQKVKKMQLLESSTTAAVPKKGKIDSRTRCEVTLGDYIKGADVDCLFGRKRKEKRRNVKGLSLSKGQKSGSTDEDNVSGKCRMDVTEEYHGEPASSQIALSSASLHVSREGMKEISPSKCLPKPVELKHFPQMDGQAKDADSISPSSFETCDLHNFDNTSCADDEKEQTKERNRSILCCPISGLIEIIKAANHAYEIQVASDVYMVSGLPIADFETFIQSATPVIGQISCRRSENCLHGQLLHESQCQDQMSSIALSSVWEWYEEPGCFGLEVEINRSLRSDSSGTYSVSEFSTYYVPSLSAIQLFGQSKKLDNKFDRKEESSMLSTKHERLMFEYIELEMPSSRPPLFIKIKQLVDGMSSQMIGDPEMLESLQLCDLHPASWFCVAWYPIYPIPHGSCRAAFLTYHCLGQLVPQTSSSDMAADGPTHVICPVVGLLSYNSKGEKWFELREPRYKQTSDSSLETDRAQVLNKRLQTLRHAASVISEAVLRATGEGRNNHQDFQFFLSRSG
ncbi:hypothetical protein ACP4OV_028011 [Aristida adscensionis]